MRFLLLKHIILGCESINRPEETVEYSWEEIFMDQVGYILGNTKLDPLKFIERKAVDIF